MVSTNLIRHKQYGVGLVIASNRTEDKNLRIFVVWQDIDLADVVCGWYILNETDFIIGENK